MWEGPVRPDFVDQEYFLVVPHALHSEAARAELHSARCWLETLSSRDLSAADRQALSTNSGHIGPPTFRGSTESRPTKSLFSRASHSEAATGLRRCHQGWWQQGRKNSPANPYLFLPW